MAHWGAVAPPQKTNNKQTVVINNYAFFGYNKNNKRCKFFLNKKKLASVHCSMV